MSACQAFSILIYQEHNHALYFDEFEKVFSDPSLKPYRRRFFSGNAISFLNLSKLAGDKRVGKIQTDYWRSLIAKNAAANASATPK